jgi:hypothetical protein
VIRAPHDDMLMLFDSFSFLACPGSLRLCHLHRDPAPLHRLHPHQGAGDKEQDHRGDHGAIWIEKEEEDGKQKFKEDISAK